MKKYRSALLPLLCGLGSVLPAQAQLTAELEARNAEPGVTYGSVPSVPLPKTILFSAGPEEIAADAEAWQQHGVSAFFLDYVARDWSSDVWATDGEPWTIGASDKTFQKVKQATAAAHRIGSEVFLKVAFDHVFEWFNDTAWRKIEENFRQMAIFARDSGCDGIAIDIEYVGQQYHYNWSGYDYKGYTRADLLRKVQQRMTGIGRVLYDEFPNMVFLTFPECGFNLGTAIQAAWIKEAAHRHAPGGVHYCTEYTYRNPNIRYMLSHVAQCNELFHRLLTLKAWKYWRERCSIAAGVWPFGFDYQNTHDPGLTLEQLRQGVAASLMVSSRYNWLYSHNSREQMLGRKLDVYTNGLDVAPYLKIIADRQIITDDKYITLARAARQLQARDFSAELGLASWVTLMGPADAPTLRPGSAQFSDARDTQTAWRMALDYFAGRDQNFKQHFGTVTDWLLIGPFPSDARLSAHHQVFPPEQTLDLQAECDGVNGKVRWKEHRQTGPNASVDLTKEFQPTERVCAYALCFVTSPIQQEAQIRVGVNDAGKVWFGGKLILDYPNESSVFLDREIIPVHLPRGTTPVLLKVTNNQGNWGFVFRVTDLKGHPLRNLNFSLTK